VIVVTNAPAAVNRFDSLWAADFDPQNHRDIVRWPVVSAAPDRISTDNSRLTSTDRLTYSIRYPEPSRFSGTFPLAVVLSPENPLGSAYGLLYLLSQAGPGHRTCRATERAAALGSFQ
jgi:hypothetical protein